MRSVRSDFIHMEQNQLSQNQKINDDYESRHQKKLEEQKRAQRKRTFKKASKLGAIIIIFGAIVTALSWYIAKQPQTPASDVISKSGIHWHPELTISIKGQKQDIPANIGLGVTEQSIHTHDATGTLHLEIQGLVTREDIKLGRFFKIWGKQFNSNCIFDSCNSPNGKVKMLINGKENNEFENYPMQDKDKIEIRYE